MGVSANTIVRRGMVHGRFQVFHLEHLSYVLTALDRCEELVVGITNPDDSQLCLAPESDQRHLRESNPYTFFERQSMVRASLAEKGVDLARVAIVPFHLLSPSLWRFYIPEPGHVIQYVRCFGAWEERKVAQFRAHGYEVVQLDPGREKAFTATDVRALMAADDPRWREYVPEGTARVIDEIHARG